MYGYVVLVSRWSSYFVELKFEALKAKAWRMKICLFLEEKFNWICIYLGNVVILSLNACCMWQLQRVVFGAIGNECS